MENFQCKKCSSSFTQEQRLSPTICKCKGDCRCLMCDGCLKEVQEKNQIENPGDHESPRPDAFYDTRLEPNYDMMGKNGKPKVASYKGLTLAQRYKSGHISGG